MSNKFSFMLHTSWCVSPYAYINDLSDSSATAETSSRQWLTIPNARQVASPFLKQIPNNSKFACGIFNKNACDDYEIGMFAPGTQFVVSTTQQARDDSSSSVT